MPCIIVVLIVVRESEAPDISAVYWDEVGPRPIFAATANVVVKVEPGE